MLENRDQLCQLALMAGTKALFHVGHDGYAMSLRYALARRPGDYLNAEKQAFASEIALARGGWSKEATILKSVARTLHAARINSDELLLSWVTLAVRAAAVL